MPELTPADRVIALLEWGDVAEVDAEIENTAGWQGSLWRGTRALMEGRFAACERFAAEASEGDELAAGVLVVALRREQERVAEAEIMLRLLLERFPSAPPSAHALLALLVAEMGRDTQARHELTRLLPHDPVATTGRLAVLYLLSELAATIDAGPDELGLLHRRLLPRAGDFAVEERGAACYGSIAFALGRLSQALGRWDEAAQFYDDALVAHERVGAPLMLAHAQRQLAALLRVHGDEADWDRATDLLSAAASIYAQLGVENRAVEAQAVLARAGTAAPPRGETVFRRGDDGWEIGPPDATVRLRDASGLQDIARLLAAPLRSVHVTDLIGGAGDAARREYELRLNELAAELVEAERASDGVRAALVRAERDSLRAVLDGAVSDPTDQARLAVGTRIRISLDRIEQLHPPVGRHLRTAIRTGTFCSYEPDQPVIWRL